MPLAPKYFFLKYTDLCNSHCRTCQLWQSDGTTLSLADLRRIGKHIDPANLLEVYFTGGEPFLPVNAVEMATFLHEWKPSVAVTGATNALRPDLYLPKVAQMKKNGVWINVLVSLNGLPEWHDYTRGCPGNYDRAIEMIKGLHDLGCLLSINLLEVPAAATERGTTEADRQHVREIANQYGVEMWKSGILRNMPWFGVPDDGATIPAFNCHAGTEAICIHANGDITACQEPRQSLRFGNLRDECIPEKTVERIQREIKERRCQPCGCCTGAFTLGLRCAT